MAKEKSKKRKTKWYPGKLIGGLLGTKKKRLKKAYEAEGATKEEAKKKAKEKAKGAGRIRKGAVGVESTKGGEYVKYGKKHKAAKSFREAFKAAEGKDFTWDGRKYSGKTADDVKKAKAAADAESKKASEKVGEEIKKEGFAEAGGKVKSYKGGGKVEASNPYGWPTRDARNGGQK